MSTKLDEMNFFKTLETMGVIKIKSEAKLKLIIEMAKENQKGMKK